MRRYGLSTFGVAVTLSVLALYPASAWGQTSAEIEKKFGTPVTAFEVERGVLMLPKYDGSGQICEAVLENSHRTDKGFDFGSALTDWMIGNIVEKLMPAAERGEKSKHYGWSLMRGQTDYSYENLTVIRVEQRGNPSNTAVLISWKNRPCG